MEIKDAEPNALNQQHTGNNQSITATLPYIPGSEGLVKVQVSCKDKRENELVAMTTVDVEMNEASWAEQKNSLANSIRMSAALTASELATLHYQARALSKKMSQEELDRLNSYFYIQIAQTARKALSASELQRLVDIITDITA